MAGDVVTVISAAASMAQRHCREVLSVPRPPNRIIGAVALRAFPPDVPDLDEPLARIVHIGADRLAQLLPGDTGALAHQRVPFVCNCHREPCVWPRDAASRDHRKD